MPQYLYRIQPRRPALLPDGPTEDEAAAIGQHFAYLQRLTEEGVVLLAGRTLNTDSTAFGIVIFEANTDDDAQALCEGDPAVAAGVMDATLFPYRVALWSSHGPSV